MGAEGRGCGVVFNHDNLCARSCVDCREERLCVKLSEKKANEKGSGSGRADSLGSIFLTGNSRVS